MLALCLFFIHYTLLLLFGILLSVAFSGIQLSIKKNIFILSAVFAAEGVLQLIIYLSFDELLVWKLYPVITHLPIILLIYLYYHKKIITGFASVCSAYLCCQPAKWLGLLYVNITQNYIAEQIVRIAVLLLFGFVALRYIAPYLSQLFNKDTRSVCILAMVPIVYYLFDYSMGIYTDFWETNHRVAAEFLPFFLCAAFLVFCIVYYKEYEQKADAERKEQIIRIAVEQQAKDLEAIKRSEHEIHLFRHDLRLLLSSLLVCIEGNELNKAKEIIASYSSYIDGTMPKRFCKIDTINYILSDFSAKCSTKNINFIYTVEIEKLKIDELLFSTILVNALDNALNAQELLPAEERSIKLMIKNADDKLLLSVRNPTHRLPEFVDGLPITSQKGHGYGTQSIRYMVQRLGGKCQFTVQDGIFITRMII